MIDTSAVFRILERRYHWTLQINVSQCKRGWKTNIVYKASFGLPIDSVGLVPAKVSRSFGPCRVLIVAAKFIVLNEKLNEKQVEKNRERRCVWIVVDLENFRCERARARAASQNRGRVRGSSFERSTDPRKKKKKNKKKNKGVRKENSNPPSNASVNILTRET